LLPPISPYRPTGKNGEETAETTAKGQAMTDNQIDNAMNEDRPHPKLRRSAKGNLYAKWGNRVLTVFERPLGSGWGSWCYSEGGRVAFSELRYRPEHAAMMAAYSAAGWVQ